jgi:predicted transcriptional regulator
MKQQYRRILAGIELMDGTIRIDRLSRATGIDNRTINNALRTLEPEFVTIVGHESRVGDRREDPKVLQLTDSGAEIGKEAGAELNNNEPLWAVQQKLDALTVRVSNVEEANAELAKENRKLKRMLFDQI